MISLNLIIKVDIKSVHCKLNRLQFGRLKVPMKCKIIVGYLKGFSKFRRMALSF